MRRAAALLMLTALPTVAAAEVPRVVTDMMVTQSLTALVMGDLGTPALLMDPGADPHSFQLRPSQAAALQEAGLLVWVGPGMTPWLADHAGDTGLELLAVPGTYLQDFAAADDHADHGAEAAGHEGHDHEGQDPHAWLDPQNAAVWVGAIAERLATLDADNAATYRANAAAAAARITALDTELSASLAPLRGRGFVVTHDAYGYFTAHFGLSPALPVAAGDASAPGAAHLADLRDQIAAQGVTCAFPEARHHTKPLAAVIEGSAARLGGALDPEGIDLTPGPTLYENLMRGMAATLTACLAG